MIKTIVRSVGRGISFAPPAAVAAASFLNLTTFQRQFLILILLIWVGVFLLFGAWSG